jgi:hypothetical protein
MLETEKSVEGFLLASFEEKLTEIHDLDCLFFWVIWDAGQYVGKHALAGKKSISLLCCRRVQDVKEKAHSLAMLEAGR